MSYLDQLEPRDAFNRELESQVHPPQWRNPNPAGKYNLVVIGAGTAGLVTAAGAAGLGAKVALIERGLMGGDCLNVGCVPSKALLSAAKRIAAVRNASEYGIRLENPHIDFAEVMQRMRRLRSSISPHDSAERFRQLGIDVFFGQGTFTDGNTVQVGDQTLRFKRAVVATGARASELPIPGLAEAGYLTNETLFSLTELPRRLIVIGGGPIGAEMAQCFARFGSQVTLIDRASHILSREESDAAEIVQDAMQQDGVHLLLNAQVTQVKTQGIEKIVIVQQGSATSSIVGDAILVAIGRTPNLDGLGLDTVGVEADCRRGIRVDDRLRTTNRNIYAAGDVCSEYKFTHAADFLARIVIQNTLFMGRARASALTIPWCTYTSPELAHVGVYPGQSDEPGIEYQSFTQPLADVDRAILEGETRGFVRVHCRRGSDRILGATIVAAQAGDLISQITLAMQHRIGLGKIASAIHPYPTRAEAIRKLGDQFNRTKLTPFVKKLFDHWLRWSR
ncbi:MAG: mercuric reductase [bacterium]|nr:mercuric reductase [bacterium]